MKKIMFILTTIMVIVILSGCQEIIKEQGEKPTKPFTVDSYLGSNAVYESSSSFTIKGTSEGNVVIKLELIGKNNKVIDTYETIVNEKNLTWNITFETPRLSNDTYKIRLFDAHNTYVYEYTNIRFGHLWLVAGDGFINYPIELEEDKNYKSLNDLAFYEISNDSHWLTNDEKLTKVSSFDFEFAQALQKKTNAPIGIIVGDEHSTLIEDWLPLDVAKSIDSIYNYLQSEGKYSDNPTKGKACYLFENELKSLTGISLSGIVWNQGERQTELFTNKSYEKAYFQMLTSLLEKWRNYFHAKKIMVLQTPSSTNKNAERLRYIQNTAVNYYTFAEIIPTFDLNLKEKDEIVDVDVVSVAMRTVDVVIGSKQVSSYANLVLDINDDDVVDKIKVEFDNVRKINLIESDEINCLVVKYKDPENGIIVLDIKPEVFENYLIFDLAYEKEITNKDGEIVKEINYYNKSLILIEFGQSENIANINIFNDDMIPILPFMIEIE